MDNFFHNQPPEEGQRSMSALHVKNRENASWGDPLTTKANNVIRVYSLNLNGLALDRRGGQYNTQCRVAREIQVDIMCCQEHKMGTTNLTVKSILYQTSNQHWHYSRLQFGSTDVAFTNWYKLVDTMLLSTEDITGQIQAQSSDYMGRWVTQTFTGYNGTQVTILSSVTGGNRQSTRCTYHSNVTAAQYSHAQSRLNSCTEESIQTRSSRFFQPMSRTRRGNDHGRQFQRKFGWSLQWHVQVDDQFSPGRFDENEVYPNSTSHLLERTQQVGLRASHTQGCRGTSGCWIWGLLMKDIRQIIAPIFWSRHWSSFRK